MARDATVFSVAIIRPRADEIPEEVRIGGLVALAKVIAARIREEAEEAGAGADADALAEEQGKS